MRSRTPPAALPSQHTDAAFAAAAAALALLIACLVLEVWNADLRVPFDYSGDAAFTAAVVKNAVEEGALWENDELGAPRGQELYDFPVFAGDNVQLALVRAIGVVVRDPIVAFNLFYLLTFPLAALTAFLVLRRLGVGLPGSLVASVLYALLPYHFLRGQDHLFLAAYWAVPLGCFLVALGARGRATRHAASEPADARDPRRLRRDRCGRRLLRRVHARPARRRRSARGRRAANASARSPQPPSSGRRSSRRSSSASLRPSSTALREGSNPAIERFAFETEVFSLRPLQLVLPVRDHRLEPLADLKERYEEQVGFTEASFATLGLVGQRRARRALRRVAAERGPARARQAVPPSCATRPCPRSSRCSSR